MIFDVNQLEIVSESSVGDPVFGSGFDVLEIVQFLISPLVEGAEAGSGTTLSVQVDARDAESDDASEQRLLHVGKLLEGHVLDDGRQLVVITDHDPAFEPVVAVLGCLQKQRNERFNLQYLSRFFHQDVVVFETQFDQLPALESRVGTRHGDDLGFANEEVAGSIQAAAQQLESAELFQLAEDAADVAPAAIGDIHILGIGLAFENGRWSVIEERFEREVSADVLDGGAGIGAAFDSR